ncbi:MAG TPA: ECF-type sigma factor [Pirellulaceae bacterium]|nr:ECF-type sigma factor [Pirellulaceae bacterium]HMO93152.1 ECF-type sigma factor [Pirellulaceae bacterium]HMP70018.1 ECF-type sigma factor [Pirellulaceae bacterium]
MPDRGSISILLKQLGAGDELALAALHRRCWPWLVQMAGRRLGGPLSGAADNEDVAQEAFWGFFKSVREGRVPQMESRNELFALLTHIVACKAATQIERHLAFKRGGGQVRGESVLDGRAECNDGGASHLGGGLQGVGGDQRTPVEEAILSDCYEFYIDKLPEAFRPFAERHVAGLTNAEIAAQLDCVERTVERKLALIRARWQEMAEAEFSRG